MKEIILSIFLLFPMFCFTQKVGDSIQIISQGNREYNGSIVKIINKGYLLKPTIVAQYLLMKMK
jgi:hypothetical protein